MGQSQPRRAEVAAFSDPFAGEPLRGSGQQPDAFSDPYAGEPLRVATKSANLPEMRPVASHAQAKPKEPTWSDQLGLNTPNDSMLVGFLKGAGSGAVDVAQGTTANVVNRVNRGLRARDADRGRPVESLSASAARPQSQPPADAMQAPDTFSGKVGEALPGVVEMAAPIGVPARAAINAIPRVARAGEKFQEVMGAAKNIPLDVKDVGDVALRINQLAERGGSMPMAVRKILNRMTDPNKAPMTYEEGRDFASNISRLSVNEFGRLTPAVAREVANLRVVLNKANADAAKAAGKGAEYKAAMREYAQAMRLREAVEKSLKTAKKVAPYAAGAGLAAWMTREVRSMLSP